MNSQTGRPRLYATNAERQRAYRQRLLRELRSLRRKTQKHPRHENDVYNTPPVFARAGLSLVQLTPRSVLDVGAGQGVWGQEARHLWPNAQIVGVDLRALPVPPDYDEWWTGDFLELAPAMGTFDLVMGNPPYHDKEGFVRAGLRLLEESGELLFMFPSNFRQGKKRAAGLFRQHPLAEMTYIHGRPQFYQTDKATGGMTEFAFFRWIQGFSGPSVTTDCIIPPG